MTMDIVCFGIILIAVVSAENLEDSTEKFESPTLLSHFIAAPGLENRNIETINSNNQPNVITTESIDAADILDGITIDMSAPLDQSDSMLSSGDRELVIHKLKINSQSDSSNHLDDIMVDMLAPSAQSDSMLSSGDRVLILDKPKNNSQAYGSIQIQGLCGFPVYNNRYKCLNLNFHNQRLLECEVEHGAAVFGFFVFLLALSIIFSNCLLPIAVRKSSEMRTHYDYIKVSLSFADITTGFVLLGTVIPNMVWMRKASERDLVDYVITDTNSPTAIVVGSLLTMSAQASLLHLVFLSVERFIAIKWPFWHMIRKTRTVVLTLGLIWMVSLLCSFVPAAFPDYFEYRYQPTLLIHLMTLKKLPDNSYGFHREIYVAFALILPYAIMVVICIMTCVVACRKMAARSRKFGLDVRNNENIKRKTEKKRIKPEIKIFSTIIIMIAVFTITLAPFTVVMILYVGGVLDCTNYSLPYLITFYIGMTNGFANAIVYTFRDQRFRIAVCNIFRSAFKKTDAGSGTNPNSSQSTQL